MKPWLDIVDYYMGDVSGCSLTTVSAALRNAAQEFCARTKVWRKDLAPITTTASQETYAVPLAAGEELVKVLAAKLNGHEIDTLLYEHAWSGARGIILTSAHEVKLQPAVAGQLVLRAVLQPSNAALGLEDTIYAKYARSIAHGAKAELFGASNKVYSDPAAAAIAQTRFDDAIRKGIVDAARAYGTAPLRVRPSFM
jgi:hypothetical protein